MQAGAPSLVSVVNFGLSIHQLYLCICAYSTSLLINTKSTKTSSAGYCIIALQMEHSFHFYNFSWKLLYTESSHGHRNSKTLTRFKFRRRMISISDYKQTIFALKAPTGMVYNEIQAAYIGQGIKGLLLHLASTKHYHFVCFRLSSHMYVLIYVCLYVRAYN